MAFIVLQKQQSLAADFFFYSCISAYVKSIGTEGHLQFFPQVCQLQVTDGHITCALLQGMHNC